MPPGLVTLEALLEERGADDELELIGGTLEAELEPGHAAPPTMPKGEGWLVQVLREIQL